ncbi:MAG: efflux transporter outer membrane subunit [Candidatus Tectimicrobiota bacterium]
MTEQRYRRETEKRQERLLIRACCLGSLLASLTLLPSACTVGPHYEPPVAPIPVAFKEAEGWKIAQPADDAPRGPWWEIFQDPQLNALQEQIEVSNQSLAMAEAQFRSARAAIGVARAAQLPTVTGTVGVSGSRPSLNRSGSSDNASSDLRASYQLPLEASYELDVWGRIRRLVEANIATAQASAADVEAVRLSLHAELAVHYFSLRGLDAQKQLLDLTVSAFERALELTTNRYNQGVASQIEVVQATTQLETVRAQVLEVGVQRTQFEHAIAILLGKPPSEFTLEPAPMTGPPPLIPLALPATLLERRPDIAAAERRVAAANAQIGAAQAAFYPTVTLRASAGLESSSLLNLFSWPSTLWSLGSSLAQVVFDGGRRQALTEQARAAYDATVASYRQTVLVACQNVEDNLAVLRILEAEAAQQAKAQAAAETTLLLSLNRYKGGVTTYLEVITAQSAALTAARTSIDLLTRRMNAAVLLIRALGGGWIPLSST